MAAPITHIVLAEKVFEKYFADKNREEFLIGTSFPDIRRQGNIDRDLTHFEGTSLAEILPMDSFKAGLYFHSLVDQMMKVYRKETGYEEQFPESKYIHEVGKVYEDICLYDKVTDWGRIIKIFDRVLPDELQFGVDPEIVKKWHLRLKKYLSRKPVDTQAIGELVEAPIEVMEEIIRKVKEVKDEQKARRLAEEFYEGFEEKIRA
jgi:hypothetical protein